MAIRLNKAMRLLNIGKETAVEYLNSIPGLELPEDVNFGWKLTDSQFEALQEKFKLDWAVKEKSKSITYKKTGKNKENNSKQLPSGNSVSMSFAEKKESGTSIDKLNLKITQKDIEQNKKTETSSSIRQIDNSEKKVVAVFWSKLEFVKHKILFKYKKKVFTLSNPNISSFYNKYKLRNREKKIKIILDYVTGNFSFKDSSLLEEIISIGQNSNENIRKAYIQDRVNKLNKQLQTIIFPKDNKNTSRLFIRISQIVLIKDVASLMYDGTSYYSYVTNREKQIITLLDKDLYIPIRINPDKASFNFEIDITGFSTDENNKTALPKKNKTITPKQIFPQNRKELLGFENIDFFDGYYLVWIIKNGKKDPSINPLKIYDKNSLSCLKLIHKYLYDRLPKNIEIIYNSERVLSLSHEYTLGKYIKILYDNIEEYGEWWEEVQNERKPSLPSCKKISQQQIRRIISLRNCYLDYLSGIPNQRNIIKVYEVRQNQQEDVFIFSVQLKNGQIAVIFENVSFVATATWVFIVDEENYKENINRIFDYFTNYEIHNKRQSLTKIANPPEKFKAVDYHKIMHDEPEGWIRRLNDILNREIPTNRIQFNQGLHISEETVSRSSSPEEIKTKHIHNELMRRLYDYLSEQYGEENVGTENRIGTKKIDVVVKIPNGYNIYEIKSDPEPRNCIREAMGQILDYAYFECEDTIHQMTIVGKTPETKEVNAYLKTFRNEKSLEIYYMSI